MKGLFANYNKPTQKESSEGNIFSRYCPNEAEKRFIVVKDGKEYYTKFYNKEKDEFIGASLLAMYNCNEYFDRSLLPEHEDGNWFMKGE